MSSHPEELPDILSRRSGVLPHSSMSRVFLVEAPSKEYSKHTKPSRKDEDSDHLHWLNMSVRSQLKERISQNASEDLHD